MNMKKEKRLVDLRTIDWSCKEIKISLLVLLILGSVATLVVQFLPPRSYSAAQLRSCLSAFFPDSKISVASLPSEAVQRREEHQDGRILRRVFNSYGSAAYVFIQMGAYRGGLDTFAVVGLASKPLHVFAKPRIECEWVSGNASAEPIRVNGTKMLPDWGYGRVYTVVVVNCTFPQAVGVDGLGGKLVLYAHHGVGGIESSESDNGVPPPERIVALTEAPGSLNVSKYTAPPEYEYLYCGSPLYGDLSPQRVREWLAYHVKLFGKKSHFVIHDAGGVHPDVLRVFEPWVEAGYVTLQDIRSQERFDGYYHNQFLVVNDCLHRYRFAAKWIFYFDVDEYIFIRRGSNLDSVMKSLFNYTQFTIEQMPMSSKLCLLDDYRRVRRQWGFEKLVFKDVKRGFRRDRKYAIQPRNALATGVHMSENVIGYSTHKTEGRIMYYHYHGTIANRREPCRKFINVTQLTFEGTPLVFDDTMRNITPTIKRFELKMIGNRLTRTPQ